MYDAIACRVIKMADKTVNVVEMMDLVGGPCLYVECRRASLHLRFTCCAVTVERVSMAQVRERERKQEPVPVCTLKLLAM